MRPPRKLVSAIWATSALTSSYPWLNASLPYEDRLRAFIAQLGDQQKYDMVQGDTELTDNGTGVNACIGHISGNDTLGIPDICMGDGPAGVGNSMENVTVFPAPVVAASTWNTSVEYVYGQALAQEHLGKGRNVILAPTINILRSPLWGRAAETFSEDTWLTTRMAVAGVEGIQSQGALACPKHFAAYNQETNRFGASPDWDTVDARVSKRALHEVYLPAFKASVQEADAASVMCSYNKVNGYFACENDWLLNQTLRQDWGFEGFVVADWYFSTRSTVAAAMAGLDISMPGGDLTAEYGFPAYFGDLLTEAVNNDSVPASRLNDMVERAWRYMFKLGQVDNPVSGNSTAYVRTQAHLDLAQQMTEDGSVLLKNEKSTLPLSKKKYSKIAVFGVDATSEIQVSENHGGFVIDSTAVVQAPLDALKKRGAKEGITVKYGEMYPGTGQFPTIPSTMFKNGGLNATYYTTTDFSGPANQTDFIKNITIASYPSELWKSWPQVFSAVYEGTFLPNTTSTYHFSLFGQGTALLYLEDTLIANLSYANFGSYAQGTANLKAGSEVKLMLKYDMAYSVSTGAYGVTLGVEVGNLTREAEAKKLAKWADVSIIFASDRISEGIDNGDALSLPGDQDELIAQVSKSSKKTILVLNTNSAVLMPWIDQVDAILESWYGGQQIGLALERLMFGDISPSGKLPVTFPKRLDDAIQINTNLEAPFSEELYVGYKSYEKRGIEPLFAFGHGLTYSVFSLDGITIDANKTHITIQTTLSNDGSVDARQIIQLYLGYPEEALEPAKQLRAFQKEFVAAGKNEAIELMIKKDDIKVWSNSTQDWEFVHGEYTLYLGFSSADIAIKKSIKL